MNGLVFHIVSGQSFFTGIVLLMLSVFASCQPQRWLCRIGVLGVVIGLMAIAVSSTPLAWWYYAVAAFTTLFWLIARSRQPTRPASPPDTQQAAEQDANDAEQRMEVARQPLPIAAGIVILVWLGAAMLELPWHRLPSLQPVSVRRLAIVGDSVTAGVGGDERATTWPALLDYEHNIDVEDISHVGETAKSASARAAASGLQAPLVIVEIGGNDILGATTTTQFRKDLDSLLNVLAAPNRQILMFELPLPPFFHEYGRIQRELARRHDVRLIPKRIFLSILAGGDSTLDSIHLSQAGHRVMMETVWNIIEPAYVNAISRATEHWEE